MRRTTAALSGPVVKSRTSARRAYLDEHLPKLPARWLEVAASSEDAFDAAVSAVRMSVAEWPPEEPADSRAAVEGWIWLPSGEAVSGDR
jgi:hypothetical protein